MTWAMYDYKGKRLCYQPHQRVQLIIVIDPYSAKWNNYFFYQMVGFVFTEVFLFWDSDSHSAALNQCDRIQSVFVKVFFIVLLMNQPHRK